MSPVITEPPRADAADHAMEEGFAVPTWFERRPGSPVWAAKWWILLVTIVAAVGTFFLSRRLNPTYQSSSTVRVASAAADSDQAVTAANDLAGQYAELVDGGPVLERAGRALRLPASALSGKVGAGTVANQNLIKIDAVGPTPSSAERRARAVAAAFVAVVAEANARQARAQLRTVEQSLKPLNREISTLREEVASSGASPTIDAQRRDALVSLMAERARQRGAAANFSQPSVGVYAGAGLGTKVQPKPALYAIAAALVALLGGAQIAKLLARRS